jgi:hypothetical protein
MRASFSKQSDLAGQLEREIRRQTLTGRKYQPETPVVDEYISAHDLGEHLTTT